MLTVLLLALPVTVVGDGGSRQVTFENQSVHRVVAQVSAGDRAVRAEVPPFGTQAMLVQCLGRPPRLSGGVGGREAIVEGAALSFPEGPPALWISPERQGRAALEAQLRQVRPGLAVEHLSPDQIPPHFAALRFAPLILAGVDTWAGLSAERRAAIQGAVAAGSVLVLGAGEGIVPADQLVELAPVRLGPLERSGPAVTHAVPRASGRRAITPGRGAVVHVEADDAPLLVEAPLGLGRLRVLGVRLGEVGTGALAARTFASAPDTVGPALRWAQAAPPLAEARAAPLAARTWWALMAFALLALLARWFPRGAVVLAGALGLAATAVPPNAGGLEADAGRLLVVPAGAGALVVGSLDLTLHRGGVHGVPAGGGQISLDAARPGGGCAVLGPDDAMWVVEGEPGARRRLTVFAMLPERPEAGAPDGDLFTLAGPPPALIRPAPARITARLRPSRPLEPPTLLTLPPPPPEE